MARIRSIKPEFWSDAKIASIPKPTALFFIALWNFADDTGIVTDNSLSLSLQVPIYRSQDIHKMLNALWKASLIQRSLNDGLVLISGWKHQKIDKPRDGKYKVSEINWITWSDYETALEESSNIRRKDRIGKDKIGSGSDLFNEGCAEAPAPRLPVKKNDSSPGSKVWETYSEAFREKYHVAPVRNAKTNSQCSQLAKRLGEDAHPVIRFYLAHNDTWYVKRQHDLGSLLQAAESMHSQWQRGKAVTTTTARNQERTQNSFDAFANFIPKEEGGLRE